MRFVEKLRRELQQRIPDVVVDNSSRLSSAFTISANILTALSGMQHNSNPRLWASVFDTALLSLGVIYKEKPQSADEIKKLEQMPLHEYIPERMKHALNPPMHIRQTLAAGFIITGASLVAAGQTSEPKRYAEMAIGTQVIAAGLVLGFTVRSEKAWQRFGMVLSTMQPVGIAYAAEAAFKSQDYWIAGAQFMHLMTAVTSWLLGGLAETKAIERAASSISR